MVESLHSQTGLMLSVFDPLVQGGAWLYDITGALASWTHTSQASGGYGQARGVINGPQGDLEEWVEHGLGRQVVLYGPELLPCFEGFVNSVSLNVGGLTYQVGPLLNVANTASIVYSTVDTSIDPPAVGMRTATPAAQVDSSVAQYGQMEKVLSSGGCTAANALQLRNMYLAENSRPESTQTIAPGGGNAPAVTLEILGNVRWLETYYYNSTTTGTTTVRNRIIAALAASPSIVYSTDYGNLDANTTAIPAYENSDKRAWDLIKAAVAMGDPVDYARYTFGIYENRKAYFKKLPASIEYIYRLSSGTQRLETPGGEIIPPWNARPARWAFLPDFLIGRVGNTTSLRSDPRNVFIESLTYTAPYSLSITGGKTQTLGQKMAQLGLSGIGG